MLLRTGPFQLGAAIFLIERGFAVSGIESLQFSIALWGLPASWP